LTTSPARARTAWRLVTRDPVDVSGEARSRRKILKPLVKVVSTMDTVVDTVDEAVVAVVEEVSEVEATVEMVNLVVDRLIEDVAMLKHSHNYFQRNLELDWLFLALYKSSFDESAFSVNEGPKNSDFLQLPGSFLCSP
jgi:hypothetical protein